MRGQFLAVVVHACTWIALGLCLHAQTAQFKGGVDVVGVTVVVTDRRGEIVNDLQADDFEVTDRGTRRRIVAFKKITAASAREVPFDNVRADTSTNQQVDEGLLVVLLLDDVHSDPAESAFVRHAASSVVRQFMGDADQALVAPTSGDTDGFQDFTSDKAKLLAAIERFHGRSPRSAPRSSFEQSSGAGSTLRFIRRLAQHLAPAARPVSMMLVTPGFPVATVDGYPNMSGSASTENLHEMKAAINAAKAAGVAVTVIDPRPLGQRNDAFDGLRPLAGETGGLTASGLDLEQVLQRFAARAAVYYVLGYELEPGSRRGTDRVVVRVPNRRVEIFARPSRVDGHAARRSADGTMSPRLSEVLRSPVPLGGLDLRLQAAHVAAERPGTVYVVAEIADAPHGPVDVALVTVDSTGNAGNGTHARLDPPPSPSTGMRWGRRLQLAPGKYQVRLGADAGPGRVGLVTSDLTIEPRDPRKLAMTDLLLSSPKAAALPATGEVPALPGPWPLTLARRFAVDEGLAVAAWILPPTLRQERLRIRTRVEDASGRIVIDSTHVEPQGSLGRDTVDFTAAVEPGRLSPGWHVLRVSATVGDEQVERVVQLQIVG